jgi:N-acetylglucosaminyldiphosphoundecaprenol N-acetyl-beta-D-mannosaminyltransferase
MEAALRRLESLVSSEDGRVHSIFFVNAHTLNLAFRDPGYRSVLLSADCIFGDGTGVRWAARLLHGARLEDNVNGTDLVPQFLRAGSGTRRRLFLLGASPEAIPRAARHVERAFPAWTLVGYHHGYVDLADSGRVVEQVNAAHPDLLLVGMGNPRQERWIQRYQEQLEVSLCISVGGLFDYWAGDLDRAPAWLRRWGLEWVHLMLRQPRKVPRYLLGNPAFLLRVVWAGQVADSASERELRG